MTPHQAGSRDRFLAITDEGLKKVCASGLPLTSRAKNKPTELLDDPVIH